MMYQQRNLADWREPSGAKWKCPICELEMRAMHMYGLPVNEKSILVRLTKEDDRTELHVESYRYELKEREDILKIFCMSCLTQFAG